MARADQHARLDSDLASLDSMPLAQLREKWAAICDGRPVPRVSAALLRLALAWEMQAKIHGGHSRETTQRLDQLAAGMTETHAAQPGMRLVREWNGKLHVVTMESDGMVCWNETNWKSLSAVAREITGTRWSGPAFFGLKHKAGTKNDANGLRKAA